MNIPYEPILTTPSFIPVGECLAVWALLCELVKKMIRKVLLVRIAPSQVRQYLSKWGCRSRLQKVRAQIVASDASPSASLTRIINGDEPPGGGTRGIFFRMENP
jgi:hypothetical protein